MPEFKVPCSWSYEGYYRFYADSKEEAIQMAEDKASLPVTQSFKQESFKIHTDEIEEISRNDS